LVCDEAHFISNIDNYKFILKNNELFKHNIFTTATPTNDMLLNNDFGVLIDEVKIYELINDKIICNFETIIKKVENNKKEYHDTAKLIVNSMIEYNKKKGIIYVNDCSSAENLYRLLKKYDIINTYIYISYKINIIDENDDNLDIFEKDNKMSVVISVGKISYGYDNSNIDFICFADSRSSSIDIRQIIGRGFRWKKDEYPDKLLHILLPIYKDEINEHLRHYLEYIISECGKENILKINSNSISNDNENNNIGKNYIGDDIPIEIIKELSTTGNNMFSNFMLFLKNNNVYDELTYNNIYNLNTDWMCSLENLKTRYPKFNFQMIHPNRNDYYETYEEAKESYDNNIKLLQDKIRKYNLYQILKALNEVDNKIPIVNLKLYY
jgi:superfamily II DNA or RNA helicase